MLLIVFTLTCHFFPSAVTEPPIEAPLPSAAVPLDEPGRYKSIRTYEETLDFYQRFFKQSSGVRWRNIVNLPGIKAKHIECLRRDCLRRKTHWEGINIYEKRGEVRIYVLPWEPADLPSEKKRSKT